MCTIYPHFYAAANSRTPVTGLHGRSRLLNPRRFRPACVRRRLFDGVAVPGQSSMPLTRAMYEHDLAACHRAMGRTGQGGDVRISAFCRARKHPRSTSRTTLVVSTRRREFRESSLMRTHARPRAELESPRARVPHTARCELPPRTRLRVDARIEYWSRSPGAYGHRRSRAGTPRSCVKDQVPGTMHRRTSIPWTPPRGGRRMPAE